MFQINSLTLSCRVVGTPEYAETRQGRGKLKLRLSQPTRVKDSSGEHQTKMMFFTALAFGTLADQMHRQITEAQDLTIQGELKHREYVDRADQRREVYEILIESFVPGLTREQRDLQPRRTPTDAQPEPPAPSAPPAAAAQRRFDPAPPAHEPAPTPTGPTFAPTYATPRPEDDPEPARTDLRPVAPAKEDGGLKMPW